LSNVIQAQRLSYHKRCCISEESMHFDDAQMKERNLQRTLSKLKTIAGYNEGEKDGNEQ